MVPDRNILLAVLLVPLVLNAFVSTDSDRVLVVYNLAWTGDNDGDGVQDSEQIKTHYVSRRSIPASNVLGVSTRLQYYYSTHQQFFDELVVPITNKLAALGPQNIDVILLVYGIPYRTPGTSGTLCVDNCLMNLNNIGAANTMYGFRTKSNPYHETTPMISVDKGHFSHSLYKYSDKDIYMVCRLSAPDAPRGVINLIEQARYGEAYLQAGGWSGGVYVDSRWGPYTDAGLATDSDVAAGRYYAYDEADKNIAFTEHYVSSLPLFWENLGTDREIGESGAAYAAATNALFYSGWYNYGRYLDVFDWLPGSAGCDLNSNSAQGMRDGSGWIGGAFRQGLTCAAGVIGEPYLDGHQRPNVFLYYLLQGYTFAEASALATPYLEWQCTNLGDPLYAPFEFRPPVNDVTPPVLSGGYPVVDNIGEQSVSVTFRVDESATEPEVVRCRVEYGMTPALGQTSDALKGCWVHNVFELTGLPSGTTVWYRVVLEDPAGYSTTSSVASFETLNAAPVADFTVNASTGRVPLPVEFDASGSVDDDGSIVSWSWQFGDGSSGSGKTVQHTYTSAGLATASLTVTDDDGAQDTFSLMLQLEPTDGVMYLLQDELAGYTNATDTYISSYSSLDTNKNFGAATSARVFSNSRRTLVWFGMPWMSEYEQIVHAELRLYAYQKNYGGPSDFVAAYRVTQQWAEGDGNGVTTGAGATWDDADRGTPWAASGGSYDATPVAQVPYDDISAPGQVVFDVTTQVVAWAQSETENHGFLIKPLDDDCLVDFRTRESFAQGERPMLLILTGMEMTEQGTPYGWLEKWYPEQTNQFETLDLSDADSDSFVTWQEYIADTDPTASSSRFRITGIRSNTVFFSSSTNRLYRLYWSDDLSGGEWFPADVARPGAGGSDSMSVPNDFPQQFLKMTVELP